MQLLSTLSNTPLQPKTKLGETAKMMERRKKMRQKEEREFKRTLKVRPRLAACVLS